MSDDVISADVDPVTGAIENAIEGLGDPVDDGSPAVVEAEPVETAEPDAKADEAPAAPTEEDEESELAKIATDLIAKNPGMTRGRISIARHQAVLTRNRNRDEAARTKIQSQLKALEDQYGAPEFKRRLELLQLAEHDPDRFYPALKGNPRYAALIQAEIDAALKAHTPTAPAPVTRTEPVTEAVNERPKPDVLNADGSIGYSNEQAGKLAQWYAEQATAKIQKEMDGLRGEFKPFVVERQTQAQLGEAVKRQSAILENARKTWPHFEENLNEIRAYISKPENKLSDLREAYMAIVPAKLAQQASNTLDREKIAAEERAKILKESAPRVPKDAAIRPGALPVAKASPDKGGPADLEDIIRQSIRNIA
jgi:hypothetical protein